MTNLQAPPLTARRLLFADHAADPDALRGALARVGAATAVGVVGLSPAARRFARHETERLISSVLELDVLGAVARAWAQQHQLAAARRRTQRTFGQELVELAAHDVTSRHPFHVEVLVDGLPRQRVDVELALRLRLQLVAASVAAGHITAIEGGEAELSGTLTVQGVTVVERRRRLATSIGLGGSVERPARRAS